MTRHEEKLECISCHEKRTQKKAIEEGWRVVDYTHEMMCEMCATTICPLTEAYLP